MSERITKAELMEGICPKCHGFHTNICHQAERALADRLAEALGKALETIYWMSGSTDFGPNGQAGQHWRDDALPANEKARAALAAHEEARR